MNFVWVSTFVKSGKESVARLEVSVFQAEQHQGGERVFLKK